MRLSDVLTNVKYEVLAGNTDINITKIVIDSRIVAQGSLFVCLKGEKEDGHSYIDEAVRLGASAVMVSDSRTEYPEGLTVIKVTDTRLSLCRTAANFFGNPADKLNIIGVTGTKGKTSTTYFMESVLNELGRKVGVIGTVDIRIGNEHVNVPHIAPTTPDTVILNEVLAKMLEAGVTDVVMEVSSHALVFNKVEGICFKTGIFTNLAHDHLDFHGTMENYMLAKAKLFKQCEYGVINIDNQYGSHMREACVGGYTTYSIDNESDLQALNIKYTGDGVHFQIKINGADEDFFVPVQAKFTVYNVLGVIGAAMYMGVPLDAIKRGLSNIKTIPGRMESVPNTLGFNVIVDYAHTPDSLVNIINAVREFTKERVIMVFGCGGDRDKTKRPVMGRIVGELSDFCIITSDNPRTEDPEQIISQTEAGVLDTSCKYERITDRKEAIYRAIEIAEPGDSVIIAGKGHENYQIFADHTIHFDDMEVAAEALASKRSV